MLYLKEQLQKHPSSTAQDIIKLCYQAAFGGEHMLSDTSAARAYLEKEFEETEPHTGELFERISDEICRINIAPWKMEGLPCSWLWSIFEMSARTEDNGNALFEEYLSEAKTLCPEFSRHIDQYLCGGIRAVHHSDAYRKGEAPHYRIAKSRLARLIPILRGIHAQNARIIAIDGRAASGKSTMAAELSAILGAGIIHMDDFFLPPSLRTEKRLNEAGGNIHYERFAEEILPKLSRTEGFEYNIFDCSKMAINGKRAVAASPYLIIEGAYSHHPFFGNYAHLKVFSHIDPYEQMLRIIMRNGQKMAEIFRSRWIPLEERYYSEFNIAEQADLTV